MNKGGYKFSKVRCSVCGKLIAENWIIRHAKRCNLTLTRKLADFVSGRRS